MFSDFFRNFFEKSFLTEASASVEIGACSFQSRCEVYNEVHRARDNSWLSPLMSCLSRKWQTALRDDCLELNEQRLEEGYFWWSLVNFHEEVSLLHCTNLFVFVHDGRNLAEEILSNGVKRLGFTFARIYSGNGFTDAKLNDVVKVTPLSMGWKNPKADACRSKRQNRSAA